jgi:hypothetical protein
VDSFGCGLGRIAACREHGDEMTVSRRKLLEQQATVSFTLRTLLDAVNYIFLSRFAGVKRKSLRNIILSLSNLLVTINTACFNTLKLCNLPTECICVFRMVLTINIDCFPKQH